MEYLILFRTNFLFNNNTGEKKECKNIRDIMENRMKRIRRKRLKFKDQRVQLNINDTTFLTVSYSL